MTYPAAELVVVVTSDTVILALIAYVLVVGPFALLACAGSGPGPRRATSAWAGPGSQ